MSNKLDIETFKAVLPLHMKIVDMTIEHENDKLNRDGAVKNIETENENLIWLVQFLYDKLNDIKIDSIRHGLLTEDDYSWRFGKPSECNLFD